MAQSEELKNSNGTKTKGSIITKKRFWIPLIIFIAAAVVTYYWYVGTLNYESTDDAFIDADKLSLSSKMLGRITVLKAEEGDTVKQGEILVKLDSSDITAQINQARTSLKLAEENISLSNVNVNKAEQDFKRAESQFKSKVIPKEQYEHAKNALDAARAEFNITKSKIAAVKSQIDVLNTQLNNTVIVSPMNGVVAKKWLLEGDVVQPGQPIFSIYNINNIWITAEFEETKIPRIQTGDSVSISVDAYPDNNFEGTVLQLGSNTASQFSLIPPNNASGNFTKVTQRVPVKISIKPAAAAQNKLHLLPGMSVEVDVKVKK